MSVQGSISEHIHSIKCAFNRKSINGEYKLIKNNNDLKELDAIIIPGGESTTISKILNNNGLYDLLIKRIENNDLYIMGTCAGCVLLAKEIIGNEDENRLLNAMDMRVERNAFGRQKESFEKYIKIQGFIEPYKAVFIRAPIIHKIWGKCKMIAKLDTKIIAARQEKFLALSFHPELTNDFRIHEYFLDMVV